MVSLLLYLISEQNLLVLRQTFFWNATFAVDIRCTIIVNYEFLIFN